MSENKQESTIDSQATTPATGEAVATPSVAIGINNGTVAVEQVVESRAAPTDDKEKPATLPKHGHISKGEKIYNWAVYSGLNYWANLGISLAVSDYFCNLGGKKSLIAGAEKTARAFEKMGANFHSSNKIARVVLETLSLLSGGFVLLIPMKLMEDNKRKIVYAMNEKLGVDQHAPDGHLETPDEIYMEKEQPKQSWGNVLKRRMYGVAAVQLSAQAFEHAFMDRVHGVGGRQVSTDWIVGKANQGLVHLPGGEKLVKNDAVQRYLKLAALDTIFTKITALVMHATNGAGEGKEPNEIGDDDAPKVDPASVNHLKMLPAEAPQTVVEKHERKSPEAFRSPRQSILSKATHVERAVRSDDAAHAIAP